MFRLQLATVLLFGGAILHASFATRFDEPTSSWKDDYESLFTPEFAAEMDIQLQRFSQELQDDLFSESHVYDQIRRKLYQQERPCNAQFSNVTAQEIQDMITTFLGSFLPAGNEFQGALSALMGVIKYDLVVAKVCLSCADITEAMLGSAAYTSTSPYGFPTYCSSNSYGYNAMHSALVLAPVDPSTGEIFTGKLRGMVVGHGLTTDVNQGPSDLWPDSVTEALHGSNATVANIFNTFHDFLVTVVAATSGAIGVQPDYIGYGESKDYNRTFFAHLPYKQAFGISYLAAQQYVANITNGCTMLDNAATVTGFSEGGYSCILGALAMEQNGVKILTLYPGSGPLEPNLEAGFGFGKAVLFKIGFRDDVQLNGS